MSDRRAVSAGHLAASSVAAAQEPWRVAIGGNRVQNMTVEQITQAYQAGQLTARTPLWPPGTSGWQALGNFEQFQAAAAEPQAAYGQLSQFEETDDAPTRMWTGSGELEELEASLPSAAPAVLPPAATAPRAAIRTGTHPVAARPRAVAAATQPGRMSSTASGLASTRAPSAPARSSGLWLVAGLVGLVGLGSAVLAARGSWSSAAPAPEVQASATPSAETKHEASPSNSGSTAREVNQARLAKYEDTQGQPPTPTTGTRELPAPSAPVVAEAQKPAVPSSAAVQPSAAPIPTMAEPTEAAPEPKPSAAERRAARNSAESSSARAAARRERAAARREHAASSESKLSSEPKVAALAPITKHEAAPAVEAPHSKPAKAEAKAETPAAVSSSVNDAAATALTSAAKLAASCRPRGGPAGAGKARIIYSPDGDVQSVEILTAKFRDTLTGSCVRMVFRRAKIPAFKGEPPTFIKSFTIPEE
jgi:DNA polymerase III gamma/tau subunit